MMQFGLQNSEEHFHYQLLTISRKIGKDKNYSFWFSKFYNSFQFDLDIFNSKVFLTKSEPSDRWFAF